MSNEYPAGTTEAEAYALGYAYATRTDGAYDWPLSGEWADMPTPYAVTLTVARTIFGGSWGPDDLNADLESGEWSIDYVADHFEQGYAAYRDEHGK